MVMSASRIKNDDNRHACAGIWLRRLCAGAVLAVLAACHKPAAELPKQTTEVTVMTVEPRDTPVDFEFTAQTESSREVEIRARVDGFLDKRVYTEGQLVHAGQTLFLMDPKPFEAALQSAKGQLAQQQARLTVTKANLARVLPLVAQNALSQKERDDAIGNEKEAEAAVIAAKGQVQTAELNLSYTTIKSPLTGLSSFAKQQDGSYVTAAATGLLTTVYQLDPMWVNFSISENELLAYRDQIEKKQLRFPANDDFEVTVVLADGTRVSVARPHQFRQSRVQHADRHLPRAGVVREPERHLAPGTVRARAGLGRGAPERDPRAAARGAAGIEEPFRLGGR